MGNENSPQVKAMQKAGFTEEEIADVLKCDKAIDQGENLFPLDPTLEAGAKKARRADRTDTPKPKARVEDKDKQQLMRLFRLIATEYGTDLEIVNPEREFLFTYNGKRYKVVMSVPRT